jgi:transketolase
LIYDDFRDAVFENIYEAALKDKNIIVLLGDQGAQTFDKFRKHIPEQLINVGASEQSLMGIASGLARNGKKVFIHGITPFVTLRCFEQINLDIGYSNLPITIIGIGTGISYSHEGVTHHATQDVAVMKSIPNLTIYNPSDSVCLSRIIEDILVHPKLSYIRFDHSPLPNIRIDCDLKGFEVLKEGRKVFIATGNMVHTALELYKSLRDSINIPHGARLVFNVGVIDLYRLPINPELKKHIDGKEVYVFEEHLTGGFSSSVADFILDNNLNVKFKRFVIKDYVREYGDRQDILNKLGLSKEQLVKEI